MADNCNHVVVSEGHNLEDADTCGLSATGDLRGANAGLAGLADNGGLTHTHALQSGSAAIDAADTSSCPATDQRGAARPIDGDEDRTAVCDVGAYEAGPATITDTPAATPTSAVTSTPGPAQLPQTGEGMEKGDGNMGSSPGWGLVAAFGFALAAMSGLVALSKIGRET
jgi:hypothetical protein